MPEADRLQGANSFEDTGRVLLMTRAGVAWMAVGCALGAYEHALAYATEREQFGQKIAGFQLIQDLLVQMLGNTTASAALCVQLSRLQDAGGETDAQASLAKAFCTVRTRATAGRPGPRPATRGRRAPPNPWPGEAPRRRPGR